MPSRDFLRNAVLSIGLILVVASVIAAKSGRPVPAKPKTASAHAVSTAPSQQTGVALKIHAMPQTPLASHGISHALPGGEPGLIVCPPATTDHALCDFAAGCGAWLHLRAAGAGALGKTPAWSTLDRAQQEMARKDLCLTMPQANRLAGLSGATHVAVGTLTGTAAQERLEYRVWAASSRKQVGPALVAEGTEEQILTQLPALAAAIDTRLGVTTTPSPPIEPGMTAQDLRLLGSLQTPNRSVTDEQKQSLVRLAVSSPLANVTALQSGSPSSTAAALDSARRLLALAPDNALALGEVALTCPIALVHDRATLDAARAAYPRNALFAYATVMRDRITCDWQEEQVEAAREVRDAPENPEAWLNGAASISYAAGRLRKARLAGALSPLEGKALDAAYDRWLHATHQATQIDPLYGKAWLRLAEAATFDGKDQLAVTALNRALVLYPEKSEVYNWGIEMFAPKWLDAPEALDAVTRRAASDSYGDAETVSAVVTQLKNCGQDERAQSLRARYVAQYRAEIAKDVRDGHAHWDLATLLQDDDMIAAWSEYQTAAGLLPNDAQLFYEWGEAQQQGGDISNALASYKKALTLDPACQRAARGAGSVELPYRNYEDAHEHLTAAVQIDPSDGIAHDELGQADEGLKHDQEAEREYRASIERTNAFTPAYGHLALLLMRENRTNEALPIAETGIRVWKDDPACLDALAGALLARNDLEDAAAICEHVETLIRGDPWATEISGEVAMKKGDQGRARTCWEQLAAIPDGQGGYPQEIAIERLAQYFPKRRIE